ncbi:hypothetical protein L9F63_028190, partial [Diploptera punctata]
ENSSLTVHLEAAIAIFLYQRQEMKKPFSYKYHVTFKDFDFLQYLKHLIWMLNKEDLNFVEHFHSVVLLIPPHMSCFFCILKIFIHEGWALQTEIHHETYQTDLPFQHDVLLPVLEASQRNQKRFCQILS